MNYYFPVRINNKTNLQYGKIEMPLGEGRVSISDVVEAIRACNEDIIITGIDDEQEN